MYLPYLRAADLLDAAASLMILLMVMSSAAISACTSETVALSGP